MNSIQSIDDLNYLEKYISRLRMSGLKFLFRGQSNASWTIQTTLFRHFGNNWNDNQSWDKYHCCYNKIKKEVISMDTLAFKPKLENEDFYILSMIRHLGFPCHLLDWSACLNTSILFACSENKDIDGSLWILSTYKKFNDSPINISPFDVGNPILICKEFDLTPTDKSISDFPLGRLRRFRQSGFMSIVPCKYISKNFESLLDRNYSLCKITIPANLKESILKHLYGCNAGLNHIMVNSTSENNKLLSIINIITNELNH